MKNMFWLLLIISTNVFSFDQVFCKTYQPVYIPSDSFIISLTYNDDPRVNFDKCTYRYDHSIPELRELKGNDHFIAQCELHGCDGLCQAVLSIYQRGDQILSYSTSAIKYDLQSASFSFITSETPKFCNAN